ncbi:MAG: hypothetical protein ACJ74W_01355 [Pyrinomonadaceae bacterium]
MLILLAFLLPASLPAQQGTTHDPAVDLGAFTKELMIMRLEDNHTQVVIWFPFDFFVASGVADSGRPKAEVEQELDFLKTYLTVMVQNSIDKPDGGSVYASEAEVRARAALRLEDGSELLPLRNPPPKVAALMAAMKSFISAEGDASSANMHILVFPAVTKQGAPVVQTARKDKLTLMLKANGSYKAAIFVWRTPFDAAVEGAVCPKCRERMSPKWSYCPYDGQKLP